MFDNGSKIGHPSHQRNAPAAIGAQSSGQATFFFFENLLQHRALGQWQTWCFIGVASAVAALGRQNRRLQRLRIPVGWLK